LLLLFACLIGGAGVIYLQTMNQNRRTEAIRQELMSQGLDVIYGEDVLDEQAGIPLLHSLAPKRIVRIMSGTNLIADAHLPIVARLEEDVDLTANRCPITDAGLKSLQGMTNLRFAKLARTQISDEGIKHLHDADLESLDVTGTKVSDEGLRLLAEFHPTRLKEISLDSTNVTDKGLQHLASIPSLVFVTIGETKVTPEGMTALKNKNPQVMFVSR
jgi:hypothetical protein